MNDNELLYLIEENDEIALTKLIEKYTPKIKQIISKYKTKGLALGLDISDLYQEGLIGLLNAIKTYDKNKDASFKTFANVIIERQIQDNIKTNDRKKYKTLNNAISIDNFYNDDTKNLYDIIENTSSPEIEIITKEFENEVKKSLTEFELKVYDLKIDGKTNDEISIILNKTKKSIENTLLRIKSKIKLHNIK